MASTLDYRAYVSTRHLKLNSLQSRPKERTVYRAVGVRNQTVQTDQTYTYNGIRVVHSAPHVPARPPQWKGKQGEILNGKELRLTPNNRHERLFSAVERSPTFIPEDDSAIETCSVEDSRSQMKEDRVKLQNSRNEQRLETKSVSYISPDSRLLSASSAASPRQKGHAIRTMKTSVQRKLDPARERHQLKGNSTPIAKCEAVQILDLTISSLAGSVSEESGKKDSILPTTFPSKPLRCPTYVTLAQNRKMQNGYLQNKRESTVLGNSDIIGLKNLVSPSGEQSMNFNHRSGTSRLQVPSTCISEISSFNYRDSDEYNKQIKTWMDNHRPSEFSPATRGSFFSFWDRMAGGRSADIPTPFDVGAARRRSVELNLLDRAPSAASSRSQGQPGERVKSGGHSRTVHGTHDSIGVIKGQSMLQNSPRKTPDQEGNAYFWHPDLSLPAEREETDSDDDLEGADDTLTQGNSSDAHGSQETGYRDVERLSSVPSGPRQLQDADVILVSNNKDESPGGARQAVTFDTMQNNNNHRVVTFIHRGSQDQNQSGHLSSGARAAERRNQPIVDIQSQGRPDVSLKFDENLYATFQHRRFSNLDAKNVKKKTKRKSSRQRQSKVA